MAIINQIKAKLLELDGGTFQRLCDDWLYRKGYENINAIGMMQLTDRVVKGTPDCLLIQPDGRYIFSEYTVQQDRLAQKLEADICKCLDEKKTGISSEQISEIIICCLGKLSTQEINHLNGFCKNREVKFTLNGLDSLALSIQNDYPVLSEIYLSLPLDTGQLLSIDDFVSRYGKNNLTTSIDNKILFQDEALEKGRQCLEHERFLLITGSAGVGKTLFAVHLSRIIKKQNPQLKVYCLFNKGADLFRDITAYFSEPGDYLIFIDDANRLDNRIDYILHYLNEIDEKRSFRIIATVRDYARGSVIDKVSQYTQINEKIIQPLSDEQIKELIIKLFNIKNMQYQQRIQEIAGGNARLAIMASKVATKTKQIDSIQNVTSLYDDYFGQNENIREVIENEKLMATACVISFFRTIDKLNESQMSWVQDVFGIQAEEFCTYVDVLHRKELVDLYENKVVRISDQVLSTYLFYLSVFEKKIIPFSIIVNNFYPDFKKTIVDVLNPVISAFDHKKIIDEIRREIQDIFNGISKDPDNSIEFLNSFWFALPTESLRYANKTISKMQQAKVAWEKEVFEEAKGELQESSLIKLLSNFRHFGNDELKISFELILNYLEKNKESLGYVIKVLKGKYNFKPDDFRYGYAAQTHVVDKLIEQMNGGKNYLFARLFILTAESFLKVERTEYQWNRGNTVSLITFRLSPDEYLLPLRKKLIENLSCLFGILKYKDMVQEVFQTYIGSLMHEGKNMAQADLPYIKNYLVSNLNHSELSHCLIMQELCEQLDALDIEFPVEWKSEFKNKTLDLSNLLLEDRHERQLLEMGLEEYNQYRHQCLVKHFAIFTQEELAEFFEQCDMLKHSLSGRKRDYSFKIGMDMCLSALGDTHPEIFKNIIALYLDYDELFELNPYLILSNLFRLSAVDEIWELINSKKYKRKKLWCSCYFSLLPEEFISENKVDLLLEHINTTSSDELANGIDFLLKYHTIDKDIFLKVTRILIAKSDSDKNYARPLGHIFSQPEKLGAWIEIFKSEDELLFDAYLAVLKLDYHFDYSGEALDLLTTKNPGFLEKVVDCIYQNESRPSSHTNMPELDFLWGRQSFLKDLEQYALYVHNKEKDSLYIHDNIFRKLFLKEKGQPKENGLTAKKQTFLKYTLLNNVDNIQYVCFIFDMANFMSEEFRRELLSLFLQKNKEFKDFKKLEHVSRTMSWSGSKVPILEREKNYLISLLPLFNSVELLEHRAYVEKQIEYIVEAIENEKKRNFLESRD